MPLPHFLLLVAALLVSAAVTLWVAVALGVPLAVVGLVALIGAGVAHLAAPTDRSGGDHGHQPGV